MKPSQACIDLVKECEGFRARAYRCPAGVLTIGYGTTKDVREGDKISEPVAAEMLLTDLEEAASVVNDFVQVELNQNQFDALCSFVYNLGQHNFSSSTLLKLLNGGSYSGAAAQFGRWSKAGSTVLAGLVRRRMLERDLFLKATP